MVLVLIDHDRGQLEGSSLEALTMGRRLSSDLRRPLAAVIVGDVDPHLVDAVSGFGAENVHLIRHDRLAEYAPEAWAESIAQLMAGADPSVVIAPGTDRGNEVMARLAARTDLAMAANCTDVDPGDDGGPDGRLPFVVTRLRWGGSLLEEARLHGDVKLLTLAPHSIEAAPAPVKGSPTVNEFKPTLSDEHFRVRVTGRVERPGGGVSLAEARVVVGGGRGVGGPEGFDRLEELAGLLGGAVGCSRVVTSLGWRPHSDQVGQTGIRISPDLYIACGISGAIQHMVGCKGAKHLMAINTDAEAPIMARADYAVIGDVKSVIPALVEELKRVRAGAAQ